MTLPTYDQLYEQYNAQTLKTIRRILGCDLELAEDLNQDVWMKVHNHMHELHKVDHFSGWLKWQARSVIKDQLQKQGRQKRGSNAAHQQANEEQTKDPSALTADQLIEVDQAWQHFQRCFDGLSNKRKNILHLTLKGSPLIEIAKILDDNKANIKSLNSKAKKDMMDCMSKSDQFKKPLSEAQIKTLMQRYVQAKLESDPHFDEATLKFFITELLDEDEMDDVRDHLAICTSCKSKWRELMYLDSLIREELESEENAATQTEPPTTEQAEVVPIDTTKSSLIKTLGPYALAAAIFFAMFFNPFQKPTPIEPSIVPFIDLEPLEDVRRSPERASKTISLENAHYLQLIYAESQSIQNYRLEITAADDTQILWQFDNPPQDAAGTFSLLLPANFLKPGSYQVRLVGDETLLHTYPFQVE